MDIEFDGMICYWRGPAPWFFVTDPAEESDDLNAISRHVTYGWGVIPVQARIGQTEWQTSLFPKDGRYLVPIKAAHAFRARLVDECHLFLAPTMVGGGKRGLPDNVRLDLALLEERGFGNGTVYLRYRVR